MMARYMEGSAVLLSVIQIEDFSLKTPGNIVNTEKKPVAAVLAVCRFMIVTTMN